VKRRLRRRRADSEALSPWWSVAGMIEPKQPSLLTMINLSVELGRSEVSLAKRLYEV
jgi:hypothetical protein